MHVLLTFESFELHVSCSVATVFASIAFALSKRQTRDKQGLVHFYI